MRRLAWVVLLFISLFSILTYAVKGFRGGQITPELWLFQTGYCQQPCWHGIRPGDTTLVEAERMLQTLPFVSDIQRDNSATKRCDLSWNIDLSVPYWGCAITEDAKDFKIRKFWIMRSLEMTYRYQGVGMKDLLLAFGLPDRAGLCNDSVNGVGGLMYFGANVEVTILRLDYDGFPSPFHQNLSLLTDVGVIIELFYRSPDSVPLFKPDFPRWEGFTTLRKSYSVPVYPSYRTRC